MALCCTSLTSCTNENKIPEGMQLVSGGEALGYYFYAPEEWTISNLGAIKSAYVSRVDPTSVSFVKVDPKDFLPEGNEADAYFFGRYLTDSMSEFRGEPQITDPDGEAVTFGAEGEAADKAKRYTYTYEYFDYTANQTVKFGYMQYLLKHDGEYYIFTYASTMEKRTGTDVTFYEYYLDTEEEEGILTSIINSFRFVSKNGEEESPEWTKDTDGYVLASDPEIADFYLYVPESFKVDYSSAIVSATHNDGTNVNMTRSAGTNENVNAYMHRRFGELRAFAEKIEYEAMKDENGNALLESEESGRVIIKYTKLDDFGGAINAYAYEYTYEAGGVKHHVYQVIAIDGWLLNYTGYVFTYTVTDANRSLHADELVKIIEKVEFE